MSSPLAEPTVPELFSLPADQLTDVEFKRIIAEYRNERHSWNKKEKEKEAKRGAPKVEKGSIKITDLSDLGL